LSAKANFRNLGKRFGKGTPQAAAAVTSLPLAALLAFERGEKVEIAVAGVNHLLEEGDLELLRDAGGDMVVSTDGVYIAAIDPTVTPQLRAEGLMREVVSRVQRMRKEGGLAVSDRISLWVWGNEEVEQAVRVHSDHVAGEVLARALHVGSAGPGNSTVSQPVDLDGLAANIAIRKEN
jgi:isoleucyl-tRNA synthetase